MPKYSSIFYPHNLLSRQFAAIAVVIVTAVVQSCAFAMPASARTIIPPSQWTGSVAWSPDRKILAVSWPSPRKVQLPSQSGEPAWGMVPNYNKRRLILLNAITYERLPITLPTDLSLPVWSSTGEFIGGTTTSNPSFCMVYNARTGAQALKADGTFMGIDSASKRIAVREMEKVSIWDLPRKRIILSITDFRGSCESIAWSPNSKLIAIRGRLSRVHDKPDVVRVFDSETGAKLLHAENKVGADAASWSSNGKWFAYSDNCVHLCEGETLAKIADIGGQSIEPVKFSWSPDGKLIAYKDADHRLHIFDPARKCELTTIEAEKTGMYRFDWSPDSRYILLNDFSGRLAICDASTGKYIGATIDGKVCAWIMWSPDEQSLVTSDLNYVEFIALNCKEGSVTPFGFKDGGVPGNPWKDLLIPRDINECLIDLDTWFSDKVKQDLKENSESKLGLFGWPFLGMEIRNRYGLWAHTPLAEYFKAQGVTDGNAMDPIILVSYWRHLNGKPIDFEQQVTDAKSSQMKEDEQRQQLLERANIANKPLDSEVMRETFSDQEGKIFSIAKLPGKIRLLCLGDSESTDSWLMLQSVRNVREKYPTDKLSVVVILQARSGARRQRRRNQRINDSPTDNIAELLSKSQADFHIGIVSNEEMERIKTRLNSLYFDQIVVLNGKGIVTSRLSNLERYLPVYHQEQKIDSIELEQQLIKEIDAEVSTTSQ